MNPLGPLLCTPQHLHLHTHHFHLDTPLFSTLFTMTAPVTDAGPFYDITSFDDFDGRIITHQRDAPGDPGTTMLWKFCHGGDAYFTEIPKRMSHITIEEAKSSLQRVPDDEIYPKVAADTGLTAAAATSIPEAELYLKRPALHLYDIPGDHCWIGELLLSEAQIMERVSKDPHENIVEYYGCHLVDGRIKGIALKRYQYSLDDYFQSDSAALKDPEAFMQQLESAVSHLHSLGLAHNDVKPSNIMLKADTMPVLIDFGSCQPFGATLITGGTPGWGQEPYHISAKEQDFSALKRMREWLARPDPKTGA